MTSQGITVAIDGPAGAGKSTVATRVAESLQYTLVDTGAIYRAVALLADERGIAWDDDAALGPLVLGLDINFRFDNGKNHVWLAGRDVTEAIRTPRISLGASSVSARPIVRSGLLALQRRLAGGRGAVLEGRDIGTVVFPDAPVKIYLDASDEERARRRHRELLAKGQTIAFEQVLAEQRQRDAQDQNRSVAPLKPAADAVRLDCTQLSIDEVVAAILAVVRKRVG